MKRYHFALQNSGELIIVLVRDRLLSLVPILVDEHEPYIIQKPKRNPLTEVLLGYTDVATRTKARK